MSQAVTQKKPMATVAPVPVHVEANAVKSALFPLGGVHSVFLKRGADHSRFKLSIFVEYKDTELERKIIRALNGVADVFPDVLFDYSVILRNGRSVDEIISNPGEAVFQRAA